MIFVVIGPTCSGKTDLANYLMDKYQCDAINFDAFQIYKDMDIGTAKLSKDDKHYSSYHLLDIRTPEQSFSVMEYQLLARKELEHALNNNENVVFVGGTGLYIRAALYDYVFEIEEEAYDKDLEQLSNSQLHDLLNSLDIEAANNIHVNNRKRLIRAISLIRHAKKSKTDIINAQKHEPIYKDIKWIFISPDRDSLYKRIDDRVIQMMNDGLIDEVKMLLSKYNLSLTARQGIGYKEVIQYLNKEITYEECVALIQKRTRNYAKRQITFFKNQFTYNLYSSIEDAKKHL